MRHKRDRNPQNRTQSKRMPHHHKLNHRTYIALCARHNLTRQKKPNQMKIKNAGVLTEPCLLMCDALLSRGAWFHPKVDPRIFVLKSLSSQNGHRKKGAYFAVDAPGPHRGPVGFVSFIDGSQYETNVCFDVVDSQPRCWVSDSHPVHAQG